MARPVGIKRVLLPRPPATYDQKDQTETRRLVEDAFFGPTDSVAISVADSKAVSAGAAAGTGGSDSVAQSMATSAALNASIADSKAVSDSVVTSTADSKGVSSGTRASVADSKAVSNSVVTSTLQTTSDSKILSNSANVSIADSKAVSDSILTSTADSKAVSAAAKTPVQPWDTGNATVIAADQFIVQHKHLYLTGSERLTVQGTGEMLLTDLGNTASVILGTPKVPSLSFTVPDGFFLDLMQRLTLANQVRATLVGSADLMLTDDFNTRSRITLAGRG